MNNLRAGFLVLCLVTVSACGDAQNELRAGADETPQIFTVNYPLAYFAETLAAESASIQFPAPAEVDPAYWHPDVETILDYQGADLILLNGAGYAGWVHQISLPQQRLVDTAAGYEQDLIEVETGPAHSHGPQGAHEHGDLAFTTWLDLELAQRQMAAIAAALQTLLPVAGTDIAGRAALLTAELAALDEALSAATEKLRGIPVLFSHPVYQYLQRRYQLLGRSVHWEPDAMATPAQWQALENLLVEHPARFMFWEDEPLPQVAERLKAMGLKIIVFKPQGNRPTAGDFLSVMRANVQAVERQTSTVPDRI